MGKRKKVIKDNPMQLIPYDNKLLYKEVAKQFNIHWEMVEFIVRSEYKFLRKALAKEDHKKGDMFYVGRLGRFICEKPDYKLITHRIRTILKDYTYSSITEEDVLELKGYLKKGYGIRYYNDIFHKGKRSIGQIMPVKEPEPIPIPPMNPEDSVMVKYKDEDYIKDNDFEVF